jgi:hypothetical protein
MEINRRKPKNSDKNLSQFRFVCHISHMGTNPGRAGIYPVMHELQVMQKFRKNVFLLSFKHHALKTYGGKVSCILSLGARWCVTIHVFTAVLKLTRISLAVRPYGQGMYNSFVFLPPGRCC